MKKENLIYFLIAIIFYSCGTSMRVKKNDFTKITANYSGSFDSYSFKTNSKKKKNNKISILSLFNINDTINIKKVNISFDTQNDLKLKYESFWGEKTVNFKGKFNKKGVYEIFLRKKRIIIPLFYTVKDVDRLRIAFNKNGELIIDNYDNRSAIILLMAGGSFHRNQYFFKKNID